MKPKKTKIVSTLGPPTFSRKIIQELVDNGMNIARINGAFETPESIRKLDKTLKQIKGLELMLDIKGTEVRCNRFPEKVINIKKGDQFMIGSKEEHGVYPITYPELYKDLHEGNILMMDDGNVVLQVEEIRDGKIYTTVLEGEKIKEGKSINTPGVHLNNPPLSQRDIDQIAVVKELNWDYIAASYIRDKEDILTIKKHTGNDFKIIAKIENQEGVDRVDEILDEAFGVMIARGDLAVEVPYPKLPRFQKLLTKACVERNKFVIVATEMMQSMVENPRPTRAEILDVANSVYDGASAVMTSAETSVGKYPVGTVRAMTRIIHETEEHMREMKEDKERRRIEKVIDFLKFWN